MQQHPRQVRLHDWRLWVLRRVEAKGRWSTHGPVSVDWGKENFPAQGASLQNGFSSCRRPDDENAGFHSHSSFFRLGSSFRCDLGSCAIHTGGGATGALMLTTGWLTVEKPRSTGGRVGRGDGFRFPSGREEYLAMGFRAEILDLFQGRPTFPSTARDAWPREYLPDHLGTEVRTSRMCVLQHTAEGQ